MSNKANDSSQHEMTWHLAEDTSELDLIDFEFLLWRIYYSWIRWQEDCQSAIADDDLTAQEIALLHIIRMKDRPKSVYEISRLLNRDDLPNIQYGIKKLINLGYVKKIDIKNGPKKATAYQITNTGITNTNLYSKARKNILLEMLKDYDPGQLKFRELTKILNLMKGVYEEASRLTASYKDIK